MSEKKYLPKKSEDISKWYLSILEMADLVDYGPAKGTMVIKPYGYAIWEQTMKVLDEWFKDGGVQNAYFPLFIPYSLLKKEQKHVEGFSPELALVTIGGGEELEEPLVVRPTSETIMYEMFSNWISSYRDLPLKINQWSNVVRWEKRTFPFLRTTEFLWQEGHTVHATEKGAMEMMLTALDWYKKFFEEVYALSPFVGEKSGSERFAGAKRTFSIELAMPNGKALQAATSHYLGQNFAKAFGVQFSDENNKLQYAHQTSWGLSTRAIGGLIMAHGDDNGLVLPPKIAPYQVTIITINSKDQSMQKRIEAYVRTIEDRLKKANIRYTVDTDNEKSLGYRMNEAEIRGIPIRLVVGSDEYEKKYVTMSRRDDMKNKEKIKMKGLGESVIVTMNEMQQDLYNKSVEARKAMTEEAEDFDTFKELIEEKKKFVRAYWDESEVVEKKIKDLTKATTRVVEIDRIKDNEDGSCVYSGNKARRKWIFAKTY